jgi:hypothetical protein
MKSQHQIRVPFPSPPPPKDALYKFKFEKPEQAKLLGSYALKSAAKHPEGITIDVLVAMPSVPISTTALTVGDIQHKRLPRLSIFL